MKLQLSNFAKFGWGSLCYSVFVILFGAFVRATGSGAGCGAHWPLCNGVVIPRPDRIETIIEFTHRITSGFTLILAVILVVWAWKQFQPGSYLRKSSGLVLFFTITEALVGAGLVLFQLVDDNDSVARAISMMVHLVNTFFLLACLTITAWWSTIGVPTKLKPFGLGGILVLIGCAGLLVLGASGAVTALGDTLFPSTSLVEGFQSDFDPTSHYLIRLRVYHPGIAIGIGTYMFIITAFIKGKYKHTRIESLSNGLLVLYIIQILFGFLNVVLLAPIWMQIIHLFQSTLIWICFVLLSGEVVGGLAPGPLHQNVNKPVHTITR